MEKMQFSLEMKADIKRISEEIKIRLEKSHIGCFQGMDKPLLLISEAYPGIWLEHIYDSVFYAKEDKSKVYLAENAIDLFISYQKEDGQLPAYILNKAKMTKHHKDAVGYSQTQECVAFAELARLTYLFNKNEEFLKKVYRASAKWVLWLKKNRMTLGLGLIEAFVGYDTGHDNSHRLDGLSFIGNYEIDGVCQNASVLPPNDKVAPLVAVDMNCNYYRNLMALSEMASYLSLEDEAKKWAKEGENVKNCLLKITYDADDAYFYDVDRYKNRRKYLSCTVFHLFMEGVLDKEKDSKIISDIYKRHISNPKEFNTPYPYPSMAISDPSSKEHEDHNCWGYYSQGNIALRATLWMEKYGFYDDFKKLCFSWLEGWTKHYDLVKLGQELDPITGIPTKASEWYCPTMLFYLYASRLVIDN